jgi:hypothetical protein
MRMACEPPVANDPKAKQTFANSVLIPAARGKAGLALTVSYSERNPNPMAEASTRTGMCQLSLPNSAGIKGKLYAPG